MMRSCLFFVGVTLDGHLIPSVAAMAWKNQYHKPKPSNVPCIHALERIEKLGSSSMNKTLCLGCSQYSQATCPFSCQSYINEIYRNCEGVLLPENYYFDPPVSEILMFNI